jgi:hypothetical protein
LRHSLKPFPNFAGFAWRQVRVFRAHGVQYCLVSSPVGNENDYRYDCDVMRRISLKNRAPLTGLPRPFGIARKQPFTATGELDKRCCATPEKEQKSASTSFRFHSSLNAHDPNQATDAHIVATGGDAYPCG